MITQDVDVKAIVRFKERVLGEFALRGGMSGRAVRVDAFKGTMLEGTVQGNAAVDIDQPLGAQATLAFDHIDTARLSDLFPQAGQARGILRGQARLRPAESGHALEPLALEVRADWDGGRFHELPVNSLNLNLFLNRDRVVLDDRPGHDSTIDLAGGSVRVWGRATRRESNVTSSQAQLELRDIDLCRWCARSIPSARRPPAL